MRRPAGVLLHGIAMQLTNISRDVAEDWQRGRLYVPDALLAAHGAAGLSPVRSASCSRSPTATTGRETEGSVRCRGAPRSAWSSRPGASCWLREMFISPIADQVGDLEAIADEVAPDAVVADSAHLGAALLCEERGLPFAGLGISALMLPSVDTAPFGSALPPERGGRFLN